VIVEQILAVATATLAADDVIRVLEEYHCIKDSTSFSPALAKTPAPALDTVESA
jgi:hypothetical protein